MPRILAIDYGLKRCGVAVTDPLQIIATGLDTVDSKEIMAFLKKYVVAEPVETIVVGEPKQLNNTPSQIAPQVNKFVELLKMEFPNIKIARIDERYTSKMAFQAMIAGGLGKKQRQDKGTVDKVSATLLLQGYMLSIE